MKLSEWLAEKGWDSSVGAVATFTDGARAFDDYVNGTRPLPDERKFCLVAYALLRQIDIFAIEEEMERIDE